jgi:ankyrin repeat protein
MQLPFKHVPPKQYQTIQEGGRPIGGTIKNMHSFFNRLSHSPILCRAAVTLVVLAWSSLAFCGEIHDAAKAGDLAKVKALLNSNPDLVSSKDNNGTTPLHLAAHEGHKDMAELLLANKADVNAKDMYGDTPLHYAALWGYMDMVQLLLANKADVNANDSNGNTPLHEAAFKDHKDIVEFLRQQGGQE